MVVQSSVYTLVMARRTRKPKQKSNLALLAVFVVCIIAGGAILVALFGNRDQNNQTQSHEFVGNPDQNIVEVLKRNARLSLLTSWIVKADLVSDLSSEGREFTLFAPSDDALAPWQEVLTNKTDEELKNFLWSHVVPGKLVSSDLNAGLIIDLLGGESLTVSLLGEDRAIGEARIISSDLQARNGVIHVVEGVLAD